jgi:pantoate--beta-alanine ligase
MRVVHARAEVRAGVAEARVAGCRVALVPTMGSLHEGHLRLIDRARELADWVGVSVFVNPLQFGPGEDLERYPRDLERDTELSRLRGADLLFAPTAAEMYPGGAPSTRVVPTRGADRLCGAARPGHFEGVLTVVAKLCGIFAPDTAIFGRKDYQQATLIRRMALDLDLPIHIDVAPTVREADGLAMSSRNAYLAPAERDDAVSLSRALRSARAAFRQGEHSAAALVETARGELRRGGVQVEYVEVVDPDTLDPLETAYAGAVLALAARVGATRLIDNTFLSASDGADPL